ncbi:hypothetical protein BDQ17DRAFT_1426448 [Cyathus striatus]|nr:hypothetical protein BDQ17DRAFT_1426448 [Cyathus striatus]
METSPVSSVSLLILGAGWTSTFLIPLCEERSISYACTTRSGRNSTIKFDFDSNSDDPEPYKALPDAKTVLITFPITLPGASRRLVRLYTATRKGLGHKSAYIQLGATSIWDGHSKSNTEMPKVQESKWYDRHSEIICNSRSCEEEELLSLFPQIPTTVLNLGGLWGGSRSPRNWVGKVLPTKDAVRNKGSTHMIHGVDVARAILAVHKDFTKAQGQRWLLTDGRVYDWWDLASAWGVKQEQLSNFVLVYGDEQGPHARWVRELMDEEGIRALPRDIKLLGRALDAREFWSTFELSPLKARLETN